MRSKVFSARSDQPPLSLEMIAIDPLVDECDVACDAMPGLLLNELSAPDQTWLHQHTETCGFCAGEYSKYLGVDQLLDRLESVAVEPPSLNFASKPRRAGYQIVPSPVGPLAIAVSDQGVCEIGFVGYQTEAEILAGLKSRGYQAEANPEMVDRVVAELDEYFAGTRTDFDVPIDLSAVTPFTRKVLEHTDGIPFGGLTTYGAIAAQIGSPGAARAVGNALGRNPIPIIVPCHRVVANGGRIGGYTGGLEIKQRLLAIEGVAFA